MLVCHGNAVNEQDSHPPGALAVRLEQLLGLFWPNLVGTGWKVWLDLELTMPQFKLLLLIASEDGLRASDLALGMGVTPPTITTVLDRLVEHGLVRREDDRRDRRQVIARVTEEGAALLRHLGVYSSAEVAACVAALSEAETACLFAGLDAFHRVRRARTAPSTDDSTVYEPTLLPRLPDPEQTARAHPASRNGDLPPEPTQTADPTDD